MDLQEAIASRRTIHSFYTNKVSEEIIQRALQAANFAPCHLHTFPWRFTSVTRQKRVLLGELALSLKFGNASPNESTEKSVLAKILNPSHLLVASQVLDVDPHRQKEDYAACACSIQNLSLSLVSDGVGSKWSTGKITTHKTTYKIIEIDPNEEMIIGFIWIGYGELPSKIKRPLLSTIFRHDESS